MRRLLLALLLPGTLLVMQAAQPEGLRAGTDVTVRTDEGVKISKWDRGRIYSATLDRDAFAGDDS